LKFKDYLIGFLLVGLFTISMFYFAIGSANEYGHNSSYVTSDKIDLSGLEENLEQTGNQSTKMQEAFLNDEPNIILGAIIFSSLWGNVKNIWESINEIAEIILQGMANILHIPAIVLGVIIAILAIALVFSAWRVFKMGE